MHTLANATFIVVGLCHGIGALASWRAWPGDFETTIRRAADAA